MKGEFHIIFIEGSSDDWDYLYQLYVSKETEESQKSRLISALGCSLNETLLKRLTTISKVTIKL